MAISDDFSIDYDAKTVTHDSGTTVYTVLDFFKWLAGVFAQSAQMDDDYAFVSDTPTVYRWVSGWAMGDDTSYQYLKGGSIESSDGNELWSNLYSIGDQFRSSFIYVIQDSDEISPWWSPGNIDILIKVKDAGLLIDNGNVLVMSRDTDGEFDHNSVDLSGAGRNPVGINTKEDLNYKSTGDVYLDVDTVTGFDIGNYVKGVTSLATGRIQYIDTPNTRLYLVMVEGTFQTSETINETLTRGGAGTGATATNDSTNASVDVIAGYTNISITFGDITRDLNNGNGGQPYKVEIDCGGRTVAQVYQYLKYIARHNSTTTINADTGEEYRSANQGVYSDVKAAPFGTFAGGTFFGARGVWLLNYATAAFQLTDGNNVVQSPPNYQKVTASHDNLNGCCVFVAEISGGALVKNQYTIDTATSNTIVVTTTININKTPQSGKLRVGDVQYAYTSFSSSTFSGVTPDPTGVTGSLYVPLIDVTADATSEQGGDIIYSAPITVRINVRKYGFKPFTQDTNFGANGLTFSPILTTDPQAT